MLSHPLLHTLKLVVPQYNRDTSQVMYEINATYGSAYNPPTVLSVDGMGTDDDGPLYSTASTWKGYTDDGWKSDETIETCPYVSHPDDTPKQLKEILETDNRYFENNLELFLFEHPLVL